jgi:hypothetical protein
MTMGHDRRQEKDTERLPVFTEPTVAAVRAALREDRAKRMVLTIDGQEFADLRPRRVFPLSGRADLVSLLNRNGKETVMLRELDGLDAESRRVLDRALDRMYHAAKILRVDSIVEKLGVGEWQVLTDCGYAIFEVADRQGIRRLPGNRVAIADADGNRFEVDDLGRLDKRSQALIEGEM